MSSTGAKPAGIQIACGGDELFDLLDKVVEDEVVVLLDSGGNVTHWGRKAEQIYGYTSQEITGKHFSLLSAKEEGHPLRELEAATKSGRAHRRMWRVRKDNSKFFAHFRIFRLNDKTGKAIGFLTFTNDLTEHQRVEQAREKAANTLAQTNNELQRLAYVISHELQEPLSTLTLYSNLLATRYKERLGEEADEFLADILNAGRLIARMVDDLWTYARITRPAQFVSVRTKRVIEDVLDELKQEIEQSSCEIVVADWDALPTVEGNKQQLSYVFKELIANAIRHHEARDGHPRVYISAAPERDGWTIQFQDNGPGIDKFMAADVFKIYHRIKAKPDLTGTGMGLPICKKIIEQQHQGAIGFQSVEKQGATFFVWLPNSHRVNL